MCTFSQGSAGATQTVFGVGPGSSAVESVSYLTCYLLWHVELDGFFLPVSHN